MPANEMTFDEPRHSPVRVERNLRRMGRLMLAIEKERAKKNRDMARVESLSQELQRRTHDLQALGIKVPKSPKEADAMAVTWSGRPPQVAKKGA